MMSRPIVVVDIDGTIADNAHRRHLVPAPESRLQRAHVVDDWAPFNQACAEDRPLFEACALVVALSGAYEIVFCTSRPESVRAKTTAWLREHLGVLAFSRLIMRAADDHVPAPAMKALALRAAGLMPDDVAFCIDDDQRVRAALVAARYRVLEVYQ